MSVDPGATEFLDGDFESRPSLHSGAGSGQPLRAPTREEVDTKVAAAQQKLAELKRAQEELERERAALEETRRRQIEFQNGRQEMIQNLSRGVGLLEEAEFKSRQDAEQMSKTLAGLRHVLANVQAIHDETWTQDNFGGELTRALTSVENARMEWNSARLKFPVLSVNQGEPDSTGPAAAARVESVLGPRSFGELCRMGFALTWPVALVIFAGVLVLAAILIRR